MVGALHSQAAQWVSPSVSAQSKQQTGGVAVDQQAKPSETNTMNVVKQQNAPTEQKIASGVDLNDPKVVQMLSELKSRDMEVKAHEQAHLAAAGQYATSGANFTYQTGPDGKQYAIGGEVGIDTSAVSNDPQATLAKAQVVYSAALAPAQPSGQDLKVAQSAQQMMAQALADIQKQNSSGSSSGNDQNSEQPGAPNKSADSQSSNNTEQAGNKNDKSNIYVQTEQATNANAGQVGGWQDAANRLGISFNA